MLLGGERVEVQENIYVKTQVQLGFLLSYFFFFLLLQKDQVTNKKEEMKTVLIPTLGVSRLPFPLQCVQGGDTAHICMGSSQSPFLKKTMHHVTSTFMFVCWLAMLQGISGSVDQ